MNIETLENFNTNDIIDFKTLNISDISFSNPIKVKGGSYMSIPTYQGKKIFIQTPRLINSNGIIKTDNRSSIELDFDKSHWNFYEFITDVDDFNIIQIQKNSESWFNKEFPLDIVEEFYKSPVKVGRGKKPPSLKLKVPMSRGNISCSIYDKGNQLIRHNDIPNKSKILCILCFSGLRFLKQQVICEWQPIQLKVFFTNNNPTPNYIINDSLLSDDEDNSSSLENQEKPSSDYADKVENKSNELIKSVSETENGPIIDTEPLDNNKYETQNNIEDAVESISQVDKQPLIESDNQVANEPIFESISKVDKEVVTESNQTIDQTIDDSVESVIEKEDSESEKTHTEIDKNLYEHDSPDADAQDTNNSELIISDISEINTNILDGEYNQHLENNLEQLEKYKELLQTEYQSQMVNIEKQHKLLRETQNDKDINEKNSIEHLNLIIQQKDKRLQFLENKINDLINIINN